MRESIAIDRGQGIEKSEYGEYSKEWKKFIDRQVEKFTKETFEKISELKEAGVGPEVFGPTVLDLAKLDVHLMKELEKVGDEKDRSDELLKEEELKEKHDEPGVPENLEPLAKDLNEVSGGKLMNFFRNRGDRFKNFLFGMMLSATLHGGGAGARYFDQPNFFESHIESMYRGEDLKDEDEIRRISDNFDFEQFAEDRREFFEDNPDFFDSPDFNPGYHYIDHDIATGQISYEQGQDAKNVYDRFVQGLEVAEFETMDLLLAIGTSMGRYNPNERRFASILVDLDNNSLAGGGEIDPNLQGNCESRAKFAHAVLHELRPDLETRFVLYTPSDPRVPGHVSLIVNVNDTWYAVNASGPNDIRLEKPGGLWVSSDDVLKNGLIDVEIEAQEMPGLGVDWVGPEGDLQMDLEGLAEKTSHSEQGRQGVTVFSGIDGGQDVPGGGNTPLAEESQDVYEQRIERQRQRLEEIAGQQVQSISELTSSENNERGEMGDEQNRAVSEMRDYERVEPQVVGWLEQDGEYVPYGGTLSEFSELGYSLQLLSGNEYILDRETSEERVGRLVGELVDFYENLDDSEDQDLGINRHRLWVPSFFVGDYVTEQEVVEIYNRILAEKEINDIGPYIYFPDNIRNVDVITDFLVGLLDRMDRVESSERVSIEFALGAEGVDYNELINRMGTFDRDSIVFIFHRLEEGFVPPRGINFKVGSGIEYLNNAEDRPIVISDQVTGFPVLDMHGYVQSQGDLPRTLFTSSVEYYIDPNSNNLNGRVVVHRGLTDEIVSTSNLPISRLSSSEVSPDYEYSAAQMSRALLNIQYETRCQFLRALMDIGPQLVAARENPEFGIELGFAKSYVDWGIRILESNGMLDRVTRITLMTPDLQTILNADLTNLEEVIITRQQHRYFNNQTDSESNFRRFVQEMRGRGVNFPNLDENMNFIGSGR